MRVLLALVLLLLTRTPPTAGAAAAADAPTAAPPARKKGMIPRWKDLPVTVKPKPLGTPREKAARHFGLRERDLFAPQPPASLAELEAFAHATASSGLLLGLDAVRGPAAALGGERGADGDAARCADDAAVHLGVALGLVATLRGAPHFAARDEVYIPRDVLAEAGARASAPARVLARKATADERAALARAAEALAARARAHVDAAVAMRARVPRAERCALLPAVSASTCVCPRRSAATIRARAFLCAHARLPCLTRMGIRGVRRALPQVSERARAARVRPLRRAAAAGLASRAAAPPPARELARRFHLGALSGTLTV